MRTELEHDTLEMRREFHTLNEMYKIGYNMSPPEMCALFAFNNKK